MTRFNLGLSLLLLSFGGTVVQADTLTVQFTNPVLAGYVANDPSIGSVTYMDNSITAAYFGLFTEDFTWGTNTGGLPTGGTDYSQLVFTGAPVSFPGSGPQLIGTLSLLNGTSALNSLIFGLTMNFYDGGTLLGSDSVTITTTSNQYSGTGLPLGELETDADYINICGNSSNICTSSLESFEDTQTGLATPVVADLYADLDFSLTGLSIDPNVAGNTGLGVVGSLPPLGQVPEPSSVVLMSSVLLCAIGFLRHRPYRRHVA